jgi:hypothetical protein
MTRTSATPPPRSPYMPTAWTSSTNVIAPYRFARSQICRIGAMVPAPARSVLP